MPRDRAVALGILAFALFPTAVLAEPRDPPAFTRIGPPGSDQVLQRIEVREGVLLTLEVVAEDPATDRVLVIEAATAGPSGPEPPGTLPPNAVFAALEGNPAMGALFFQPDFGQAGRHRVIFTVRDAADPGRSAVHSLEVVVANVNRAPVARILYPRGGERIGASGFSGRGAAGSVDVCWDASDPDGDAVQVRVQLLQDEGAQSARPLRGPRSLADKAPARGRTALDPRSVGDGTGFRVRIEATDDGRGGGPEPGPALTTAVVSELPFTLDAAPPTIQMALERRDYLFCEEILAVATVADPPFHPAGGATAPPETAPEVTIELDPGTPFAREIQAGEPLLLWALPLGDHRLRVTARDLGGSSASAEGTLRIVSLERAFFTVAEAMPAIRYQERERKDAAAIIEEAEVMLRPRHGAATPRSVCDCLAEGDLDAALLRLVQALQKLEEVPPPRAESWKLAERLTLLARDLVARRILLVEVQAGKDEPRVAHARRTAQEGVDSLAAGRFPAAVRAFQQAQEEILALDVTGPEILRLAPASPWIAEPFVTLRYQLLDLLSAVNHGSVRISLDGRDLTAEAVRDRELLVLSVAEPLAQGPHEVRVEAADAAGMRTVRTERVFVDLAPPAAVFLEPAEGAVPMTNRPTIRGAFGDRLSGGRLPMEGVRLVVDGKAVAAGVDVRRGTVHWQPPEDAPLAEGSHLAVLRVRDRAGRTATAARRFVVDTVPPVVRIESPAPDSTLTDYAPDYVIFAVDSSGVELESVEMNGVEIRERFRREGDRFVYRPRTGDPVFVRLGANRLAVRVRDGAGHASVK